MSNKIVLIQPIFVIDEETLKQQCESINSLILYLERLNVEEQPPHLQILFGGYCSTEEYTGIVSKWIHAIMTVANKPAFFDFDKNYGKAFVVNYLYDNYADKDADWILTYDSDIIIPLWEPNIFSRCIGLAWNLEHKYLKSQLLNSKVPENKVTFGLAALNQANGQDLGCCHLFGENEVYNSLQVGAEKVVWKDDGSSIAGGALFISAKAWREVNGYRIMGIYAGDDAFLQHDMWQKGYTCTMAQTVNINHPNKTAPNWTYETWKRNEITKSIYGVSIDVYDHMLKIDQFEKEVNVGQNKT